MNPSATNTSINIEQKSKSNMPSFGPTFHELQFLHAPRNCISLKFCSQIHVCRHSQYTIRQYIDLIQSLRFLHYFFFVQYKQYRHLTIDWICVDQACFYGAWNLWCLESIVFCLNWYTCAQQQYDYNDSSHFHG